MGRLLRFAGSVQEFSFFRRSPLPPSLGIDPDPTRRSPRWGSGIWSYRFPGAYAPWLLTDVPLGLGSAEKWSRDFRAVLDLPITMQNVGYVQFTTNADRLPSSEWASPPATYNCICLSRNAAKVNSQGCKPLEIALSMHRSRNAATVQFREVPTTLAQD